MVPAADVARLVPANHRPGRLLWRFPDLDRPNLDIGELAMTALRQTAMNAETTIAFPKFSGVRCLMMPYIQGNPRSVPAEYATYSEIIRDVFIDRNAIGYLTIDESVAVAGRPHRGARATTSRALHTEAGRIPGKYYAWGGGWGSRHIVTLDGDVEILLANNLDGSCAIWDATHADTSLDGDIGHAAAQYPYLDAVMMNAGEVHQIGILTPHESLPVKETVKRQFLRIISSGVHGREPYFTENPLLRHGGDNRSA